MANLDNFKTIKIKCVVAVDKHCPQQWLGAINTAAVFWSFSFKNTSLNQIKSHHEELLKGGLSFAASTASSLPGRLSRNHLRIIWCPIILLRICDSRLWRQSRISEWQSASPWGQRPANSLAQDEGYLNVWWVYGNFWLHLYMLKDQSEFIL